MAIGQGGYKGNLDEIMESLGPQSDQGKFFKDYLDYKQNKNPSFDGNQRRVWDLADLSALTTGSWASDYRKSRGFDSSADVLSQYYSQDPFFAKSLVDSGVNLVANQAPEFLSNMGEFYREAWAPQFEGHQPLLGGPANLTSVVAGPVDTALTLGSDLLTGSVSGLEGVARGFSLDEGGWPVWSGAEAADAIEHRAANFPTYHPQTTMGRDIQSGIGAFMEGWMGHVADPLGEAVQSAAEFAGVPEESAIKWGATTSGAVGAAPMALPLFGRRRTPSDKPMYQEGLSTTELRKSLEDQLGAANDFQYISDAWRKIDPVAWRTALDDGTFGRKISQIQEVVAQDLRDVAFFVSDRGEGIPRHWQEMMYDNSPWWKDRTWYGRKQGRKMEDKHFLLDSPRDVGALGYFTRSPIHTPAFTRSATGRMLPNWGRGYPENSPRTPRDIVIERYKDSYGITEQSRGTIVHEWEHALDDILYTRLAPEARPMDRVAGGVKDWPLDYTGRARPIKDVSKLGMVKPPMMSDLSPSLKKFSDNILEAEWRSAVDYQRIRSTEAGLKTYKQLIDSGVPKSEAKKRATKKRKKSARLPFTRRIHDLGFWGKRSPAELRARLVLVNDYLAMTPKVTAWDKLQRPTKTRRMTVEDLWQEERLPSQVLEVRDLFDDMVAYDVMTRSEATALFKEVLADVQKPYTKLTTELKVGPGPGLLYGGEE